MANQVEAREIIIRGKFNDLSDILRIARAEGKRVFRVDKVRVDPKLAYVKDGCVVTVEPEGNGGEKQAWRKSAKARF